jgi:hypothetical protein
MTFVVGSPDVLERVQLNIRSGSKEICNITIRGNISLNESRWHLFRLGPSIWYQRDCGAPLSAVGFLKPLVFGKSYFTKKMTLGNYRTYLQFFLKYQMMCELN